MHFFAPKSHFFRFDKFTKFFLFDKFDRKARHIEIFL
jgi:hypothetical protein